MTLKTDIIDDLSTMIDTDEFADVATCSVSAYADHHPSNKSFSVDGIFDHDFIEINGVEGHHPVFDFATGKFCGIAQGAKITIHPTGKRQPTDITYTVRGVQPDGTGITRLILEAP